MRSMAFSTLLAVGLLAGTANAQESARLELSGSYQFLQPMCPGLDCFNYPRGWRVSASTLMTRWLTVVGEVSGNVNSTSTLTSGPIAFNGSATATLVTKSESSEALYDFVGGPRVTKRLASAQVFGELLVGLTHLTFADSNSISIPQENAQAGSSFSTSATAWEWQPHVGIDVTVAPRWAVRFGIGYRVMGAVPENFKHGDLLVDTGIVCRLFARSSEISRR
jgi:hypothetical protein